ncbi:TspO/MBR family protein [Methanolobus profundi]|uniref:TspO and MBR related proteins n=1 Tax=Methanolobus profundi TaxID=487685 RepID=A0A1I4NVG5_9EURY|nr:TspO/MBR family protein [Methanolobus profundi]SFM19469.1 TspO and MBR related proteins [Methanolobus profundi]
MNFEHIDWKKLISSVVLCQLTGILGGIFTYNSISSWYVSLEKPAIVPPGWSFSVVWPILYLLMGISLYLIWQKGWRSPGIKVAMYVFGIQLFLNFLWSLLFFGLRSPLMGFIDILALWVLILVNIVVFSRISRTAGLILVPYLLWVSFAAYLNYYLMILNA